MGMDEAGEPLEIAEAAFWGRCLGVFSKSHGHCTRIDASRQSKFWVLADTDPRLLLVSLFFLAFGASCDRSGPEAIADRFMASYYGAANLEAALELADGLAARKIQDQQALRRGQVGSQSTEGRRVSFSRIEKTTANGKLFFRYEVRIDIRGGGAFTRRSLLALSQRPNGWRVTNFSESD